MKSGALPESVRVLPLSASPFSLQVVIAGAEGVGEPFVPLSGEEDFARVYLAAVKGDSGSLLEFCALKLLRNAYPSPELHEASSQSNPAIAERFRLETERIRRLQPAARFFPRLLSPDTEGAEAGWLPPLLFCRSEKRFFTPPCPRCAAPLTTCRDDAILARVHLPLYSASLERFLFCATCAAEEGASSFYAYQVAAEAPEDVAASAADLFRHLGEALAQKLLDSFPCLECREAAGRAESSGRPFWEGRWAPLNFYDSPYLVTGLGLDLDRFSDLLGNRQEEPAGEGRSMTAASGASRLRYPLLLEEPDEFGRFLFSSASSGLDAVEVLYLKLTAFRQIVLGVTEYYRLLGRPHLDLHPRHILFDLARAGDGLPLFWGFQARIHGLSSAARTERLAGAADVVVPPRNPTVPYAPPEVLEFHLNPPRTAQLIVTELEDATGGRGGERKWRFHGRLADPYGIYPTPRDHDWILITLDNEALGFSGMTLPSRRDPRVRADLQELHFISEPTEMEEASVQRLRKTAGVRVPGARYKIYADFNAPSDLYSLGMILLRMLLGNDGQDIRTLSGVLEKVNKRLALSGETTLGSILTGAGASVLLERDPDILTALKKANIFYQEMDRHLERPNAIPDLLWKRAVLLALRLATRVAGFSFCADPADYDAAHPTARLEAVRDEVGLLAAEVKTLLLDRQSRNLEIQHVLAELSREKGFSERDRA